MYKRQGYNTLQVDAKGTYAQPKLLKNIQEIQVQNLPNVYTVTGNSSLLVDGYLGNSAYPHLGDLTDSGSGALYNLSLIHI